MKVTVCDVCENRVEGVHPEWIEASIPASMLGEMGERLHVDVCSLECLGTIAGAEEQEQQPEQPIYEEVAEAPKPENSITVPNPGNLQKVRYMTPDESSEATGVVRRY
jgi:NAD(P)H-dependent flavin oxidoreductase YrpB (nitropropane dioxygenase family)